MASSDVLQWTLGVQQARLVGYTLVPGFTLQVFEWLLTLHLEVSLVWNSPWSGTKLLFLLTRYLPFVDVPITMANIFGYTLSQDACEVSYQVFCWMFFIGKCLATGILTLRTWAACGRSKLSTYVFFSICGIYVILTITLGGLFLRATIAKASPDHQFFGCIPVNSNGPSYLASIYVILMLYDGGLLLVMVIQGISALRVAGESRLTRVVYRDGIIYYICVFCLSFSNAVVVLRLQGSPNNVMLVTLERVFYSIVACRVILHIREQGEIEEQGLVPSEQITGSIRFAQSNQRATNPTMTGISEDVITGGP